MKANSIKIVKTLSPPSEAGTHYRIVCMTGKNKGLSYYINKDRAILGRSDTADVQVLDTKSSREHVELVKINDGYVLTDLGSQNGVVVNDLKVTQHNLVDGDRIIIGATVFKFNKIVVERKFEIVETEEEEDDDEDDDDVAQIDFNDEKGKKKKAKALPAADANRKKIIYGVVGALLVYLFFFMEDEPKKKEATTSSNPNQGIDRSFITDNNKRQDLDRERERQLNAIIHRGRREFREGNFFRAIQEFNLALILVPDHGHSSYLLNKAKQRLDEEITMNFMKAKQESDALKYMSASVSYCSIMRLLKDYKEDERYKEADKQLADLETKLGMSKGELNCF